MDIFWCTSDNIPKGLGFDLFGPLHLTWLAVGLAVIVANCLLYRRLGDRGRKNWRITMAALLLADELFMLIPMFIFDTFYLKYLPFELCSINIFIVLWHVCKPNKLTDNFLYTVCIPGALAALLLLAGLAAVALVLNLLWDTNFMFLMRPGKGNPLEWFKDNWGNHLYGFPVLIAAIVAVMYGPIEIYRKVKKVPKLI